MEEYLTNTLHKLNSNNYAKLNLVLGNESCDLDSAVSAIVYATYLNWQYYQIKCKVCTKTNRDVSMTSKDDIFLPILNVSRKDYELKTEVAFCLRDHGIIDTNLVFRDDHDLRQLIVENKAKVILVDHHVLSDKDQFMRPYVTEIIDHRPMQEWNYSDDTRRTIEIVGSCSTLVTQRIKDLSSLLSNRVDFFNAYRVCTELLHCTIILDTVNFSKEVNKATPRDVDIVAFLEGIMAPIDFEADRKRKLEELLRARSDVRALNAAQLLKKDVKVVKDVFVPSFPIMVKDFLQRPGALEAMSEALTERECSIALLLGMDLTGGLRRDMAIYSLNGPEKASRLDNFLQAWAKPSLQLSAEAAPLPGCLYRRQGNISASRKQYIPPLSEFINLQNDCIKE